MSELDELTSAIEKLEAQRLALGDAIVDMALAGLRERRSLLGKSAEPPSEAERKQVTVMFADISGFSALSETVDAEDVRNLVNACFEHVGQVVTHYGGYIDKFIGDEMMVLFGAPVAMEDHAARALYAALEVRAVLDDFNSQHQQLRERPICVHIGVNSGLVVAGAVGAKAKREYTVMGETVNLAARFVSTAGPGQAFVGDSTVHLVGDRFRFEDRGEMQLKGLTRLYRVHELLASAEQPRVRRLWGASFVGRREEIEAMRSSFREAVEARQACSVAIVGPAGIGKSRLYAEFRDWVTQVFPETMVLRGAALPHMSSAPYYMVADLLRNAISISESDSTADIKEAMESQLATAGIQDRQVAEGLALVLSVDYEDSSLARLSPEERKVAIFAAFGRTLSAIAARAPVLLVFEDLHWTDDLSMELIEHIFGDVIDCPVLFLTLTRPITDPGSRPRQAESRVPAGLHTRIMLGELDEGDSYALVTSLAPELTRWPEIVSSIVQKGQGNPFFTEEIVGSLRDQGMLRRAEEAPLQVSDLSVPDTVWGVLAERIDRLPREQKRVLQSAAVVGRVFWTGAVSELAELDPSAELESLNEREMVQPHGQATFADDLEWIFRHVLVQEVAYSGLLKETRRQAHLRVARWLEERIRERQSEHSSLLAHHYELGEEWGKTAEWAERAGDRAAALFAHREARISFLKALSALNKTEQREDARVIDLSLKLARVSFYTATEDVQEALQRAKELADQSGDRERQVQVSTAMASWLYMAGRARPAVEMAMQSMANATALGLEDQLVVPYFILGRAVYAMGDYRRAAEMLERSNELAHQYGDNMDEISVSVRAGATLAFLGMTYQLMGQRQRGRNLALESLAASEAKRDLSRVASANLYLGTAPALFGLLDEALSHLERALSVAEEIGDFSVAYVARGFLGYCYEQRGEVDRGLQHLDQAIALAFELDSFLFVSLLEAYRAEALIRGGRAAEAVAVAEQAIRMAQETRQLGCEGETHRVYGWALHYGGGSREEAVREIRLAADIHERTGAPIVRARALYELAALLRQIGDDQGAGEADAEAAAIAHETGAMWLPVPPPTPLTVSAEEPGRHATGRPNAP